MHFTLDTGPGLWYSPGKPTCLVGKDIFTPTKGSAAPVARCATGTGAIYISRPGCLDVTTPIFGPFAAPAAGRPVSAGLLCPVRHITRCYAKHNNLKKIKVLVYA